MSPETLLVAGYAGFLLLAALVIEWLSAHTHRHRLQHFVQQIKLRVGNRSSQRHDRRMCI